MFKIELAGVLIGVKNRYPYVRHQCRPFLRETDREPAFFVEATEEESCRASILPGFGESLCLCRKICDGLLWHDVFLFHAAAIEMEGAGYLFSGKSGAGKTTHTRLWQQVFGDRVSSINGDKPLLGFENGKLMVYGSPWQGKERLGNGQSAPVKALCFIEKSSENRLERITAEEVMDRIFYQVLLPNEAPAMEKILGLMEKMLQAVPCYVLYCRPDEAAVQVAYEGLKEAPEC